MTIGFAGLLGTITALLASPAAADFVVATWNSNGGQQSPEELRAHAAGMEEDLGEIEVLVLQEVISEEQVRAIAEGLGLDHWAISDFSPPVEITGGWYMSLEVAVVSAAPIAAAAEWDPHDDGYAPRLSLDAPASQELPRDLEFEDDVPSRGFLRVDLKDDWSIFAVHWKSSRGESCNVKDLANARQRENQAAGLVVNATEALAKGRTVVIAGDLNVQAPGRHPRVGTDPADDCRPRGTCDGSCGPGGKDGYDDSISALLALGQSARILSADLPETYVRQFYPGGAIDHLLVTGPRADDFRAATTPEVEGTAYRGSDHRPVITELEYRRNTRP